ncbi:MAG: butyrate:acetyl-CoA coenzyme A-transferase [Syntrophus sp. SKADARSKE-3]|nr:butyrate:acetyl-CoA coenzyme A-transferase [Syntrophus sp. SKADARSKE-3]
MDKEPNYTGKLITVNNIIERIRPGNRIFLSSGSAWPAFTVTAILNADEIRSYDLEFIQLFSVGELASLGECKNNFRLISFRTGEGMPEVICHHRRADFIPANLIEIPFMFETGVINVDIAIITASPPDSRGYMSLGIAIDVARILIRKAAMVVVEINPNMPVTFGDTSIHVDQVDFIIESSNPLPERQPKVIDPVLDRVGWNISNIILDQSTVILHVGTIFDAVSRYLKSKKNLGIVTNVISDWVIDLIESGAISLDREKSTGGQVSTSYCYGTRRLYDYIHQNQLFSFYPIAKLADPYNLRRMKNLVSIMNVEKIDITAGKIIFHAGDDLLSGYESKFNFAFGTAYSGNGKVIFALRSTDQNGGSNIVVNHENIDNRVRSAFSIIRYVVTEYGVANLFGKSVRERALAMIEIAHPAYREELFKKAKEAGYLYPDQLYEAGYSANYPASIETMKTFKDGLELKIRPIKQSDEDMMRRLFYTFSDESKYLRYFSNVRIMPHANMQKYCQIDYNKIVSIVAILQKGNSERIIAEGRYAEYPEENTHELAFLVDEDFQGKGIGSFLLNYLIKIAIENGVPRLSASVLFKNNKMLDVFKKADVTPRIRLEGDVYELDFILTEMTDKH